MMRAASSPSLNVIKSELSVSYIPLPTCLSYSRLNTNASYLQQVGQKNLFLVAVTLSAIAGHANFSFNNVKVFGFRYIPL